MNKEGHLGRPGEEKEPAYPFRSPEKREEAEKGKRWNSDPRNNRLITITTGAESVAGYLLFYGPAGYSVKPEIEGAEWMIDYRAPGRTVLRLVWSRAESCGLVDSWPGRLDLSRRKSSALPSPGRSTISLSKFNANTVQIRPSALLGP